MTKKEFAEIYKQLPVILNPKKYMELAESTVYINYDCRINKEGRCKDHPNDNLCCCRQCEQTKGFMSHKFENKKITEEVIGLFNEKTGFWRSDIGCVLPRRYRSTTCLHCSCSYSVLPLIDMVDEKLSYYVNNKGGE